MTSQTTLSPQSKIWIYQSNKVLADNVSQNLLIEAKEFTATWISHQNQLAADALFIYNQFLILAVDENVSGASGCSIDKSVKFVQYLQEKYAITLLDRMIFTYKDSNNNIITLNKEGFTEAYMKNIIDDNTLVFNNLIPTLGDLNDKWLVPIKDSWHKRLV
jgi:hypothetical protein